ncbi:MAG: hypothetical protein CM1200mP41_25600 [Gammaproteobacteria bacterium]|nr:MAG: hypothetical protein CM1200mP41_25600 [Gammaproteobacteria bacterium]
MLSTAPHPRDFNRTPNEDVLRHDSKMIIGGAPLWAFNHEPHDQILNTDGPAQHSLSACDGNQHQDDRPHPIVEKGLRWLAWLVAVTAIGVISYFWLQLYNPPPVTHSSTRIELLGSHNQRGRGLVSDANASIELSDIKGPPSPR